jgi:hypothetical protein
LIRRGRAGAPRQHVSQGEGLQPAGQPLGADVVCVFPALSFVILLLMTLRLYIGHN